MKNFLRKIWHWITCQKHLVDKNGNHLIIKKGSERE